MAKQKLEQMELPGFPMTQSENSAKNAAQLEVLEALQTGLVVMQDCFETFWRSWPEVDSLSWSAIRAIEGRILFELSEMTQQNRSMCVQLRKLIQLCRTSSSSTGDDGSDPFNGMGDWKMHFPPPESP